MKKKMIFLLCIAVAASFCIVGCGKASKNGSEQGADMENNLDKVIGIWTSKEPTRLDANDIGEIKTEKKYEELISQIVEGETGREKEHEMLIVEGLKTLSEDEVGNWHGMKKFYVSKRAVFPWSAEETRVLYSSPRIYVFSEDFKQMGMLELFMEDGKKDYTLISVANDADDDMKELMETDKDKKFVCVLGNNLDVLLGENNEVISGRNITRAEIKGNYTDKLDKAELFISMGQLIDQENLAEINLP